MLRTSQVDIDGVTAALNLFRRFQQLFRIVGAELNNEGPIRDAIARQDVVRSFFACWSESQSVGADADAEPIAQHPPSASLKFASVYLVVPGPSEKWRALIMGV